MQSKGHRQQARHRRGWAWLGLLCLLLPAFARAELPVLRVDPSRSEQPLGSALWLIPDPQGGFELSDVAAGRHDALGQVPARTPTPLGYPRHPYWIRLRLDNPGSDDLPRLLVLWRGSKYAQTIRVDGPHGHRDVRIGLAGDSASGDLRSRHAVLRLQLPARSSTTLTIRFDARVSAVLDYRLLSAAALARAEWRDQALFGALAGFAVAISGFVLLIGLRSGERTYLWFAPGALGSASYVLYFEGMLGATLQLTEPWLMRWLGTLLGVGGIVCFIAFSRSLLNTATELPRLDRWLLRPIEWLGLLPLLGAALWPWPFVALGATWALLAVLAAMPVLAWAAIRAQVPLRGFAFATTLFLIVTVVYVLQLLGVLADAALVHALRMAALALSLLMFSFAVSERVRQRQEALYQALQRSEAELAQRVIERTEQLSAAKERAEHTLAELQSTQSQLVAAEKMASLGQLVAGVAHEINTPLGVALTASSYLGEQTRGLQRQLTSGGLARQGLDGYLQQADAAARMIELNLERAAHLVRSFKQVSVDRSSDDRRHFELGPYLRELIDSLAPSWKRRPLQMQIDCPAGLVLDSFPGALGQVLSNLVQNALVHAFGEADPGQLRLAVQRLDAEHVLIEFSDDGRGIAAEHLPKIFDPFYTTRRGQGGSGLGLHIVFNLVTQKLGGQIEAHSLPGQGTRFTLRLPRQAPTLAARA